MNCVYLSNNNQFDEMDLNLVKKASKIFTKVYIFVFSKQNFQSCQSSLNKNITLIKQIIKQHNLKNVVVTICKTKIENKMRALKCKIILNSLQWNKNFNFKNFFNNQYLLNDVINHKQFLTLFSLENYVNDHLSNKTKMFFFDIDGTLLNDQKVISKLTAYALKQLYLKGHILVLCTGRTPFQTKEIYQNNHFFKYVIGNSGASIYDIENNKHFITNKYVCQHDINLMIKYAMKYQRELLWSDGINNYRVYFGKNVYDEVKDKLFYLGGSEKNPVYQNWDNVKHTLKKGNIIQIAIKLESLKAAELYSILKSEISNNSVLFETSRVYLEVLNCAINKYYGICQLLKILKQDHVITYCFGDSLNDYEMIKNCNFGIAMSNSALEIKKIAHNITLSNNEDGIYYFLLKKKLIS